MIAALASGLLTQIEGLSGGLSGVASLIGGALHKTAMPHYTPPVAAPLANPGSSLQSFSDQLQALLLQQQQTSTTQSTAGTGIQVDDLAQALQAG